MFLEQLSTISAELKWVCYIKQYCNMIDGVMQSLELIYTQKFQKAGMSILGDAKSYCVRNSGVNSVNIYIYMNTRTKPAELQKLM